MQHLKKGGLLLLTILMVVIAQAQAEATKTDGELMRSSGKLYVVLAVVLTIIAGLVFYVVRLDKKIGQLEKESKIL